MTADIKEVTIYKNGLLKSEGLQYFAFFLIFGLAPVVFLFAYFKILRDSDFKLNVAIAALTTLILILFIFLVGIFIWLRKYWVNRIVVDAAGITFSGLFKRVQSYWADVLSLEDHTPLLGNKLAKVTTRNGVFLFPCTMKQATDEFPKLRLTLDDWQWVDRNGEMKKVELLNCPLFIYIQKKLNATSESK